MPERPSASPYPGEDHPALCILHVDMDAFYASVEERDDPSLVDKPVIVGGMGGRGVVSTCNYIARRYGVRSAMPGSTARRLCPHGVFVPTRMALYVEISKQIREIFFRYTPLVQPLSLDEAFLDVAGSRKLHGRAVDIARAIRADVFSETRLTCSVGVAPNKFLAKLSSDLDKPDGMVVVDPDNVQRFLDPLPVTRLWGVGKVAAGRLNGAGIHTIADLRSRDEAELQSMFGASGTHLAQLARGEDARIVVTDSKAKSISHETTFSTDVSDIDELRGAMLALTEDVGRRLRRAGIKGRTVQIKVRHSDFKTVTRAHTLDAATDSTTLLWETARGLLNDYLKDKGYAIRLIGMGASGFDETDAAQGDLFAPPADAEASEIDSLADQIREKFGNSALTRAGTLRRPSRDDTK